MRVSLQFSAKTVIRFNTADVLRMLGWMCHQVSTHSLRYVRGMFVSKERVKLASCETCSFLDVVESVNEHMKKSLIEYTNSTAYSIK